MDLPREPLRGWPFLVGRGRTHGYRTLLAPGVLVDSGLEGIVADSLGGDVPEGMVALQTIPVPGLGPLSCAYRSERVDRDDRSGVGPAVPLLDEHGRPLEILYGVAAPTGDPLRVAPADLEHARAVALGTFRRFLDGEAAFTTELSQSFALRSTLAPHARATPVPAAASSPPAAAAAQGPAWAPAPARAVAGPRGTTGAEPGWVLWAVVGAVVLLLAGAAWLFVLRPSGSAVTVVSVSAVDVTVPYCTAPVTLHLQGVLHSDGKADVEYHWADAGQGWKSGTSRTSFTSAGGKTVYATSQVQASPGTTNGTVSLVVDRPGSARGSATYRVTCG